MNSLSEGCKQVAFTLTSTSVALCSLGLGTVATRQTSAAVFTEVLSLSNWIFCMVAIVTMYRYIGGLSSFDCFSLFYRGV